MSRPDVMESVIHNHRGENNYNDCIIRPHSRNQDLLVLA